MRKLRIALTALMLTGLLVSTSITFVSAATPPEPTYGTATVDGNSSEWNLAEDGTGDFFANMYEAGNSEKDIFSKLYLRYDCSSGILYALVLAEAEQIIRADLPDDAFIKLGNTIKLVDGNYGNDGTSPDFAWIGLDGNEATGWEASTPLDEGTYPNLNVHTQVFPDETSAVVDRAINLEIECPESGTIIIHKEASFESATVFEFESSIPGYVSFPLVDDGSENADTMTMSGLAPGSYLVSEVVPDNWTLTNIVCDPSGQTNVSMPAVEIALAANDTVECTFTNDPDPGTIIIKKFTDPPGLYEFDFSFTDDIADPNEFELSDDEQKVFSGVEPGTYTVTEVDPGETLEDAFSLIGLSCDDINNGGTSSEWNLDQRQATINLDPGETVTCEFINKKDEGTAITLASFTARPRVGAVKLAWETGTEVDNAGFNLYRATAPGGPYTKVNAALIAAEGDPVAGARYSFLDQRLPPGTYYYKLEDVDFNGVTTLHGPVSATVLPRFRRPAYRPTLPGF